MKSAIERQSHSHSSVRHLSCLQGRFSCHCPRERFCKISFPLKKVLRKLHYYEYHLVSLTKIQNMMNSFVNELELDPPDHLLWPWDHPESFNLVPQFYYLFCSSVLLDLTSVLAYWESMHTGTSYLTLHIMSAKFWKFANCQIERGEETDVLVKHFIEQPEFSTSSQVWQIRCTQHCHVVMLEPVLPGTVSTQHGSICN